MAGLTIGNIGLFLITVFAQIAGFAMLPRTNGFSDPLWTGICIAAGAISLWPLAHLIHLGVPLSGLVPILAATVPLVTIFVGLFFYSEAASITKVAMLVVACGLVGLASSLK